MIVGPTSISPPAIVARVLRALVLGAIVLAAFAIRYPAVTFGLPALVHPDEYAVVDPSRQMAETGNPDPGTFVYPSLFYYVQAVSYRLRYALSDAPTFADVPLTTIYITGRTVTVLFSVATVLVAYLCAVEIYGGGAALIAAALTAFSRLHVANSLPITTDVPMTFFVTLSLWMSVRICTRGGRMRDYAAAAFAAGLAASTKYNGGLAILPVLVAHVVCFSRSRAVPAGRHAAGATWPASLADGRLALAAVAGVLGFVVATPYSVLHPDLFVAFLDALHDRYVTIDSGAVSQGTSYGFYFGALSDGFGALPLAAAAVGLALLAIRKPRVAAILAVFPIAWFAVMGAYPVHFDRNIVAVVPFAAIAAGCSIMVLADAAAHTPRGRWRVSMWVATACTAALLAVGGNRQLAAAREYTRVLVLPNTQWLSKTWIDENLPRGSLIAREHYTPAVDAQRFHVFEVGFWGLISSADVEGCDYLVASSGDFGRFVNHPDQFPEEAAAYHSLFASYDLIKTFRGDGLTATGPEIRVYRRRAS
ncbi:MAG TPA: glycosyltransferase family 39 protein [Candidatus Binatia bacterium]